MAIRLNAAGDGLTRTTSLPSSATTYTVCFWVWLGAEPPGTGTWFITDNGLNDANIRYTFLGVVAGRLPYIETNYAGGTAPADTGATALTLGRWYHAALVREGSAHSLYLDGVLALSHSNAGAGFTTVGRVEMGHVTLLDGNNFDGRLESFIWYEAALTLAEIRAQARQRAPIRYGNLHQFTPLEIHSDLRDFSGVAPTSNWTAKGTLSSEEGPPVPWVARKPRSFFYVAPGGGTVHDLVGTASGTGAASGVITLRRALTGATAGQGTATAAITLRRALTGTAVGQGATTGALTLRRAMAGTAIGAGSVQGTLTLRQALAGTTAGTGTATAALTLQRALTGAAAGTGSAAGAMTLRHVLSGTASGVGEATLSGVLSTVLAGTASGSGSASGILTVRRALSGSTAGQGAVSSSLAVLRSLVGTAAGVGTVTMVGVGDALAFVGSAAGQGTATGDFRVMRALAGTSAGSGNATGDLRLQRALTGAIAGQGQVTGTVHLLRGLAGVITATGAVSAQLAVIHQLSGTASGVGTVIGTLTGAILSVPTPAIRTFTVAADDRVIRVAASDRIIVVPPDLD